MAVDSETLICKQSSSKFYLRIIKMVKHKGRITSGQESHARLCPISTAANAVTELSDLGTVVPPRSVPERIKGKAGKWPCHPSKMGTGL